MYIDCFSDDCYSLITANSKFSASSSNVPGGPGFAKINGNVTWCAAIPNDMQYLTVDLGMTLLYLKSKALLCVFKIFQGKVDLRLLFKWQLVFLNVLRTLYGSKGPKSLSGGYKNFRKIAIYVIHLSANLAKRFLQEGFLFLSPVSSSLRSSMKRKCIGTSITFRVFLKF